MNGKKQKLELTWIGKENRPRLEPRILLEDPDRVNLAGIHWVIVGGESGPRARPMKPDWALNIKR